MKFRKKPIVIEASQYAPNMAQLPPGVWEEWSMPGNSGNCTACIDTPEGCMTVSPGDWVITGVKGEHYPCKPDIFSLTYEPADKPSQEVTGSPGSPDDAPPQGTPPTTENIMAIIMEQLTYAIDAARKQQSTYAYEACIRYVLKTVVGGTK